MSIRSIKGSVLSGGSLARWRSLGGMPKVVAFALAFIGVALLCGTVAGLAKDKTPTTRTVSGVVMDEGENLIKGAAIELTDLQTKKVLEIYSQEAGQYQYSDLRFDHDYTVQATYNGLSSEVRQVSSIDPRWHMVLNLTVVKPNK
ncbi:MAG: carboxypeptidase-like regulatory domain-containing protein [Terriglobia bacterium]